MLPKNGRKYDIRNEDKIKMAQDTNSIDISVQGHSYIKDDQERYNLLKRWTRKYRNYS